MIEDDRMYQKGGRECVPEVILDLEKDFFRIACISNREWLTSTLHNDFVECGKSGQLCNKEEVIDGLLMYKEDRNISIYNFSCERITERCWLVNYITKSEDELFFRASIWVGEHQLQMRFYQAAKLNCSVELVKC